jgi:uncharacterized 2Fe-2S/4Fe-4S cluster protein (DUF4445 family)
MQKLMKKKYRVRFEMNSGIEQAVFASHGDSLLETAKSAGIALNVPCGGKGTCGKCRVKIQESPVPLEEGAFCTIESGHSKSISQAEFESGWRLACTSYVGADLVVFVPETVSAFQDQVKTDERYGIGENAIFRELREKLKLQDHCSYSGIELLKIDLDAPTIDNPMADRERLLRELEKQTGLAKSCITLSAMRKLPAILREADFSVYCVLQYANIKKYAQSFTVLDVFSACEVPLIAGLAIDIGTTTVSALLVNLLNGEILSSGSAGNMQVCYGADVISRIIESTRPGGLERLRHAITGECLVPLISSLCKPASVKNEQIYRVSIAANTAMTHIFLGIDPAYIRLEPYTPAFFECGPLRCIEMGLPLHPDAELVTAPSSGSYVGGDITAGVYASMAFNTQEISMLIDLGTNGELVIGNVEFLMSCACSAGPAFEGGDICCGMRAADGAIEACTIDSETMEPQIKIIGAAMEQKPLGICGSGLIDLVGELFRCGIINARGRFVKEGKRIYSDEYGTAYIIAFSHETADGRNIILNEPDIDNFIRAKGAIFSAIQTMLTILDLDVSIIENVYMAGGIGSGINIQQAIRIGMLPNISAEKYHYIGNSSLHGAYSMLVSREAAEMIEKIGRDMTYIELSTHPGYMDELVAACFLPHTNGTLYDR